MNWHSIWAAASAFAQRHSEFLSIYAYMLVVTMRPKLPWPFNKIDSLNWFYEWQRDALVSLFEKLRPGASNADMQTTRRMVEVQTTVEKETSLASQTASDKPAEIKEL